MPSTAENTEQELDTRQVILEAAYEEIHVRGFQAASLSKILSSTNVTKGALYHYFPTKLALGYAVVDPLSGDAASIGRCTGSTTRGARRRRVGRWP